MVSGEVAVSVTVPFPFRDTLALTGGAGIALTIASTEIRLLLQLFPAST